jgi:hypothetical protein
MTEYQAIARLIAGKHQRSPFRQTEYVPGQKKARDPEADRAAWKAYEARAIAMAAGR